MGRRNRPQSPHLEGWTLGDRGKPWEQEICSICSLRAHHPKHRRCTGCRRPRVCDAKRWRVCMEGVPGCGPFCGACAEAEPVKHTHG